MTVAGLRGETCHVIETKTDHMVLMADDSDLQERQRGSPHRAGSETFSGEGGIGAGLEGMVQDLAARRKKLMIQMGRTA